jgi:multicomponent Na+:H+ antiporter subunit E
VDYLRWLISEIAKASFKMCSIIWSADLKLDSTYGWIYTRQKENIGRTTYANSITVTPGTLTIYTQDDRLFVHSIDKEGMTDLSEGSMDRKVKWLSSKSAGKS